MINLKILGQSRKVVVIIKENFNTDKCFSINKHVRTHDYAISFLIFFSCDVKLATQCEIEHEKTSRQNTF